MKCHAVSGTSEINGGKLKQESMGHMFSTQLACKKFDICVGWLHFEVHYNLDLIVAHVEAVTEMFSSFGVPILQYTT